MHFKFRYLQKIIGGFFLLTCVMIVILLVTAARGQRWFQKYVPYNCYFSDGGGLRSGSVVMIHGLEAGMVRAVGLDEENRVRMDLLIFKQYADRIRQKSEARLIKPVIGSNHLEISLGPQDQALVPHRGTIPSNEEATADLDTLIATTRQLVKRLEDPDGDLMASLDNINKATHNLSNSLSRKDSTMKLLLERRDLYDELKSSVTHLDNLLTMLDESSPEIKDTIAGARRGVEEATKVIKSLQKSIFIRGNMDKYLKEDASLHLEGRAQ